MKLSISFFTAVLLFFSFPSFAQDIPSLTELADYWYPVVIKGKMGYIDRDAKLRINAELPRVESYKLADITGNFIKVEYGKKIALYDRTAKLILDAQYSGISIDEENRLIRLSKAEEGSIFSFNDQSGWADYNGNIVIPISYETPMFTGGYSFKDGLWCFKKDDKIGYMDKAGNITVTPQFYSAYDFTNGFAAVTKEKDGKWGYIDPSGNWKISANYAVAGAFDKDGYALVRINKDDPTSSIINSKGKVAAKSLPYRAEGGVLSQPEFQNGLVLIYDTVKSKYGFMDHSGKAAIPLQFDYAQNFDKEGRALVNTGCVTDGKGWMAKHIGGKWAFIDPKGNISVPYFRAEDVGYFTEGMAPVKINGLWGFINEQGTIAVEPQWQERPGYFDGGLARIYEASKLPSDDTYKTYMAIGYINKEGKIIWPVQE